MDRPVVLCGLGTVGWRVLAFLRSAGLPVAVVDRAADPGDPRLAGLPYIRGDCRNPEVLDRAGVGHARGVLILTSDDLVNVSAMLTVRRLNAECRVVVRMFNQGLIPRLGSAVRNTAALSVSALTAPLLALSAVTGDGLGAFRLEGGPQQIAELTVRAGGQLAGDRISDIAGRHHLLVLAHLPSVGPPRLLHAVNGDDRVWPGCRLVVCGDPDRLEPLLAFDRGELLPGVRWAGRVRRFARSLRRAVGAIDLPVKVGFAVLFLTLFVSTLTFHFGMGTGWAGGLYETVAVIATGGELHGEGRPDWAKAFIALLRLAGAALFAGFTAILTQYLIRAKLRGAFEAGKIPDGGHVVVCGLGNVGFRCVEELARMGRPVVAVERSADAPFAATVRRMGVPVVVGDATVPEVLRQARADASRAVIAAVESELANLEIGLLARELNPRQRVVVRLTDPDFAQAVRDGAAIKLAVSAPAVAAPAFAAALFGDRLHTLVSVAGQTLAVAELAVQPGDPCLHEQPLVAAMADYHFLPVGVNAEEPFAAAGIPRAYRMKAGDRLTAAILISDLERLLRREPAPADWAVVVDSHMAVADEALLPVVRAARGCSQAEAEELLARPSFTLANGVTRGQAEELLARVLRERAKAQVVPATEVV